MNPDQPTPAERAADEISLAWFSLTKQGTVQPLPEEIAPIIQRHFAAHVPAEARQASNEAHGSQVALHRHVRDRLDNLWRNPDERRPLPDWAMKSLAHAATHLASALGKRNDCPSLSQLEVIEAAKWLDEFIETVEAGAQAIAGDGEGGQG